MRISTKILLIALAFIISILTIFSLSKPKVYKNHPVVKAELSKYYERTTCKNLAPNLKPNSNCKIPTNSLNIMKALCQTKIKEDISKYHGTDSSSQSGFCSVSRVNNNGSTKEWSIFAISHNVFRGVAPVSFPAKELNNIALDENCENFGQIDFQCDLDKNGDCINIKMISQFDQNGFVCIDGRIY